MILAMGFIRLVNANRAKKLIHGPRDDKKRKKKKKTEEKKMQMIKKKKETMNNKLVN